MAQAEAVAVARTVPDKPYVGLGYFTEDYAEVFFGRDAERKTIIGNLRASRLTLLYAESGVGKSSLLRAGVVARLRELAVESLRERGSARYVPAVFSSWADKPVEQLIAEIERAIEPFVTAGAPVTLPRDALDAAIEAATKAIDGTLLVILDQFEEYFLYRSREAQPGRLADEVARCINRSDLHANFLIAIREDAYAGLGDVFKGKLANVYGNYLHLEYLDKDDARAAITKPIDRYNAQHAGEEPMKIESQLVDNVLTQVARGKIVIGEAGLGTLDGAEGGESRFVETPYLQLVMGRLWDTERAAGSHWLHAQTLETLGGAETIIREHLDGAMATLTDEQRRAAAAAFRYLVTPTGTKIALSAVDLAQLTDVSQTVLTDVLETLSGDVRILRPVAATRHGESTRYEIYHDSLAPAVLAWHRVQTEKRLADEKAAAEEHAHDEHRRALIFRGVAAGACVLLVLAAIAAVLAVRASNSASHQKKLAQSRALAAKAEASIDNPAKAIPLAAQAYNVATTLEARSAVLAVSHHYARLRGVLRSPLRQGFYTVAYSPDGKWLAAGGSRNIVDVWHGTRHVWSLVGHRDEVQDVAFDPKRPALLASASTDGTVRLWNVATGKSVATLRTGSGRDTVAFSPSGGALVAGGTDGRATYWDLGANGRVSPRMHVVHAGFAIYSITFGPSVLAVGGEDDKGNGIIDLYGSKYRHITLTSEEGDNVTALAFDPTNPNRLLSGSDDGSLNEWSIGAKPTNVGSWRGAQDRVSWITFSPDGQEIVTTSDDQTITFWSGSARRLGEAVQLYAPVDAAAFTPNGGTVAVAGTDGTVTLWSARHDPSLGSRILYDTSVEDVVFAHDAPMLAVLRDNDVVDVRAVRAVSQFDLGARCSAVTQCTEYHLPSGLLAAHLALSPNGDRVAVGTTHGSTMVFDLHGGSAAGTRLPSPTQADHATLDVGFDHTGTRLAAATGEKIAVWRLGRGDAHGRPLVLSPPTRVTAVAFSPVSELLAWGGEDGRVELWNIDSGETAILGYHTGPVNRLAFSRDGLTLASAGDDGRVILWNVEKKHELFSLIRQSPVTGVAFTQAGSTLASSSIDGSISLWDVATREPLGEPYRGLQVMGAVSFSPDGKMLAGANDDGSVYLWDSRYWATDVAPLAAQLCSALGRDLTPAEWRQFIGGTQRQTCPS